MALKMHGKHLPAISARKPLRSKFVTSIHSVFSRWSAGATHLSTKTAPLRSLVLLSVLFAFGSASAHARGVGSGFRHLPPPPPHFGGGFIGFPVWGIEREVHVIEREIIREVPVVVEPPPPPPAPREPYVIGKSYASLPSGCMKMIEEGASYYLCSGEWYRQVGSGSATTYKAIKRASF